MSRYYPACYVWSLRDCILVYCELLAGLCRRRPQFRSASLPQRFTHKYTELQEAPTGIWHSRRPRWTTPYRIRRSPPILIRGIGAHFAACIQGRFPRCITYSCRIELIAAWPLKYTITALFADLNASSDKAGVKRVTVHEARGRLIAGLDILARAWL